MQQRQDRRGQVQAAACASGDQHGLTYFKFRFLQRPQPEGQDRHGRRLIPPGIIHAQKHIAARARRHAAARRAEQPAYRATQRTAGDHAKRSAHQKASGYVVAGIRRKR